MWVSSIINADIENSIKLISCYILAIMAFVFVSVSTMLLHDYLHLLVCDLSAELGESILDVLFR